MTGNILKIITLIIALLLLMVFAGCQSALNIMYEPVADPENLLSSVSPAAVKLLAFEDRRDETDKSELVGGIKRSVYSRIYDVKSDRPVSEVVRDAIKAELQKRGYSFTDANEDVSIGGEIRKFWIHTDVSSEDWDIIGEVSILLKVTDASDGSMKIFGPYKGKNEEKRYLEPDNITMDRIIEAALADAIAKMGKDPDLASALRKR
jgi:uncharacterized lipoprotein YajG